MQVWCSRLKTMLCLERSRKRVPSKVAGKYRSKKSGAAGKQTRTKGRSLMEWLALADSFLRHNICASIDGGT